MAKSKSKSRASRYRGRGAQKTSVSKFALIAAIPVLVLGAGGYGLNEYSKIEQMDERYCYDRPEQAEAAVFIDASVYPNLTGAQRRDFDTALEQAYASLPANGKVMIFTTTRDSSASLAKPVHEACRPAQTAEERAAIGAPSIPAPKLRRTAEDAHAAYRKEIRRILDETFDAKKAALESPLLAQLRAISRYPGFQGRDRSLTWLSDLVNNDETARFCTHKGHLPSFEQFAKRPDYDGIKPDSLAGVDVSILVIESIDLPQPGALYCNWLELHLFWERFIRANGAASVELDRLRPVKGS